jgi:hypothetical protein
MKSQIMKTNYIVKIMRPASIGFLAISALAVRAQNFETRVARPIGGGTGSFGFAVRAEGGVIGAQTGPAFGFFFSDIGPAILKVCDRDGNGSVSQSELKLTALACCKLWDADTNGTLTQLELANGFKEFFPLAEAPPGVPLPPEEFRPNSQLAKRITAGSDTDKNDQMTIDEICDFLLGKNFRQWDLDGSDSLDARECSLAVDQLLRPEGALRVARFNIAVSPPETAK